MPRAAWHDYGGDGNLDLACANEDVNCIYRNTGAEEVARVTPESWRFRWTQYALWVPIRPAGE